MTITNYISFIKAHETILLIVLAAAVIWGGFGKIESILAQHDASNLKQAQIVAATQQQKDEVLAAQVASDKAAFDALQAKMAAQNAALAQANATLATALTKQQQADSVMTSSQLIQRWQTLVPSADFDGAPMTPDGGISVSPNNMKATVESLEQVPTLQSELTNAQKIAADDDTLLASSDELNKTQALQIDGLNKQIVDDKAVCTDQIKVVKDAARKRERWIAVIGTIFGIVVRSRL